MSLNPASNLSLSTMERGERISPTEQALTNTVILQEIFKYTNVKKVRLVCKHWCGVVFSLPEPKLSLALDIGDGYTFCNSHRFQEFVSTMNPMLARRLDIQELCRCPGGKAEHSSRSLSNPPTSTTPPFGLVEFCNKFSEEVHIFKLIGFTTLIPTLHRILMNNCPNLTRIDICILAENEEISNPVHNQAILPPGEIPPKTKLQSIVVHVQPNNSFLPQQIINSAGPVLERLRIFGNWYPDLSVNNTVRHVFCTATLDATVNLEKLSVMLSQVSSSVEHLELAMFDEKDEINWSCLQRMEVSKLRFKIPKMPKLKYFKSHSIDLFECGDALEDLGGNKMKNLKTLEISKGEGNRGRIDDLLGNVTNLENLTAVTLYGIENPEVLIYLRTPFPLLERLEIYVMESQEYSRTNLLGQVLKSCAALRLKKLGIKLPFPSTLSAFINCLWAGSELFQTVKTLEIKHCCGKLSSMAELYDDLPHYQDKEKTGGLITLFQKTLLLTRAIKRLSISGLSFSGKTSQIIMPYISEHCPTIEFRDY